MVNRDSRINDGLITFSSFHHKMNICKEKKQLHCCNCFYKWCHQESNRGHKDFQSFALPTELWHHHLLIASAKVETFFDTSKYLAENFYYFSFKGFQPCAFSSNSCPSRVISPQPNSGFVMWPMTFTPFMDAILSCRVSGTVNSNS